MGAIPPQTLRNLEPGPDHIAPGYLHLPQWICWPQVNLYLALEEDLENFQEVTPKYKAAWWKSWGSTPCLGYLRMVLTLVTKLWFLLLRRSPIVWNVLLTLPDM